MQSSMVLEKNELSLLPRCVLAFFVMPNSSSNLLFESGGIGIASTCQHQVTGCEDHVPSTRRPAEATHVGPQEAAGGVEGLRTGLVVGFRLLFMASLNQAHVLQDFMACIAWHRHFLLKHEELPQPAEEEEPIFPQRTD